jgi:hypothetical protein
MMIDALRTGWPEQILTGRYAFRTRSRDGFASFLSTGLEIISDELIEVKTRHQLQIRIGNRPVMLVQTTGYPWHEPPGLKVCGIAPPGPLLTLLRHAPREPGRWWSSEPQVRDVFDNRLATVIGTLETTGGFRRPTRTVIYDPQRRIVGQMDETLVSFVCQWLQLGQCRLRRRLNFTVDGRRVARIRQIAHVWHREFQVDVSPAAGRLDPRLVLACALEQFARFGV